MTSNQRYVVLLLTTLLSVLTILFVEIVFLRFAIFERPSWHWFGVIAAAVTIFILLITCEPVTELTGYRIGKISLDTTIWLLYLVDLVSLTYLMATSGGLSGSPYGSFLMLLPTNGIIMGQPVTLVKKYYLGIIPSVVCLTIFCEESTIDPENRAIYRYIYLAVFVLMLIIALMGYCARGHPVKSRLSADVDEDAISKS